MTMFNRMQLRRAAGLSVEAARDVLVVIDRRMRFVRANAMFYTIFPMAVALRRGDSLVEASWWPGDLHRLDAWADSRQAAELTLLQEGTSRHYTANVCWINKHNPRSGWVVTIRDADKTVRFLQKLENIAHYDSLTGIHNRRYFLENATLEYAKSGRVKRPCSVILFDFDYFKQINDTYGHQAGDVVLKEVAEAVKTMLRPFDLLARYGGDEFIIFTETGEESVMRLAHRIQDKVNNLKCRYNDTLIECRISCGVAVRTEGLLSLGALIHNADIALYRAKLFGRNRIELYNDNALVTQLIRAVESDFKGFTLYYQPIFTVKPWKLSGAECLLRWQPPQGEMVMPDTLIPMLMQTGTMAKVERWVINTACAQCKKWIAQYEDPSFYVHINLSQDILSCSALCEEVISAVERSDLSPGNIVLEFSEIMAAPARDDHLKSLKRLRNNDIHVAMDHFGEAHNSFDAIRNRYVDELRIDRSFVQDIEHDMAARKLLIGLVNMSRNTKHSICALGVENDWQKTFLQALGVDKIQGYYTGEPEDGALFPIRYMPDGNREV